MVTQEVQTVVELAFKCKQILDVLLPEEAHGTLVVFNIEGFSYFVPRLVLVDLGHSVSPANFSVKLVEIQRNVVGVVCHGDP